MKGSGGEEKRAVRVRVQMYPAMAFHGQEGTVAV